MKNYIHPSNLQHAQTKEIIKKLKENIRQTDIAREYNISRQRIFSIKQQCIKRGIITVV